jgi:CheY-like chemotaxis protein
MVQGEGKLIILVAEDNEDDVFILKRAFKKNGIDMPVHVCGNGSDAMRYLKGEGQYANRENFPFPRVLVTDIKMPLCSGLELLKWLHEHPECNLIPKIVLSASAEQRDVIEAYKLGANCYFRKPLKSDDLVELVGIMHGFWLRAEIPPLPPNC